MEPTVHTNWREAFPIQEVGEQNVVFVTYTRKTNSPELIISIEKFKVDCVLSEDELVEKLNEEMAKFTRMLQVPSSCSRKNRSLLIKEAQKDVAISARRGVANSMWNNSVYYRSVPLIKDDRSKMLASQSDGPIIVGEKDGKFGYALNPNFDDYGFNVIEV